MFGRRNRILAAELRAIVAAFSEKLPPGDVGAAEDLISHGEYGVALELICTQVHEYELPVAKETFRAIEQCGRRMQMDESSWNFLRDLRVRS